VSPHLCVLIARKRRQRIRFAMCFTVTPPPSLPPPDMREREPPSLYLYVLHCDPVSPPPFTLFDKFLFNCALQLLFSLCTHVYKYCTYTCLCIHTYVCVYIYVYHFIGVKGVKGNHMGGIHYVPNMLRSALQVEQLLRCSKGWWIVPRAACVCICVEEGDKERERVAQSPKVKRCVCACVCKRGCKGTECIYMGKQELDCVCTCKQSGREGGKARGSNRRQTERDNN